MHLFFDLDGTLTDSSPGIIRCIDHALRELRCLPAHSDQLRGMIGRPLATIFASLLESDDPALLDRAIASYRTRFDEVGIFENALFPGIEVALSEWRRSGHTLQVVTAKPAAVARRVVTHFGLTRLFDALHGPELEHGACDKADLVAAALAVTGGDSRRAVMIGDHTDDIRAARRHMVQAVAVGWGYGTRQELLDAGPDHFAESVADLRQWVDRAHSISKRVS